MPDYIDTRQAIRRKNDNNPHMVYQWVVSLPSLGMSNQANLEISSYLKFLPSRIQNILNRQIEPVEINERVYSVNSPFFSVQTEKVSDRSEEWFRASGIEPGQLSMAVDEYEDLFTGEYFETWMNLIKNEDGTLSPPVIYKKSIDVVSLDNRMRVIKRKTYHGCFPTQIQPIAYAYDQESIVQYQVTFSYDH